MPLSAALLQTFHDIVSDSGFVSDPIELAPYLAETRARFQGRCDVMLKPNSTQQVSDILALCYDHDIAVVPQGGNTGHCAGALAQGGVLLNLSRLKTIRGIDPLNATISVEAGVILGDIQQKVREHGFVFPLSLAAEGSCQIGGNLATNAGGIHVIKYGNTRDLVLGIEAVLPDGRIFDAMRGLRKDNTGYDLKNLLIGSEGTLGVITACVLELKPLPKETVSAILALNTVHDVMHCFEHMRAQFAETLSAFEMVPRFGLQLVLDHIPDQRDPFDSTYDWYAVVELSSAQDGAALKDGLFKSMESLFEKDLIANGVISESLDQSQRIWALRENISEAQKGAGASIKHDISVPVSRIAEFLEEMEQIVHNSLAGVRICAFGHVGDGNIHYNLSQPEGMDSRAFLDLWGMFNERVFDLVDQYGGSFSAEHGIGLIKTAEMQKYRSDVELDMMRAIKQALDPRGIMNPGKLLPPSASQ